MTAINEPLSLRGATLRNRIGMSPMCMYSCMAEDGAPTDWHLTHYASRAQGGAALIIVEATAVEPLGRISKQDTGLWSDAQISAWQPITRAIREAGALSCVQLAHAGRKSGGVTTDEKWGGGCIAPSAVAFHDKLRTPRALEICELAGQVELWRSAAERAVAAGFKSIELHMAHGYLMHQFLSPLSNLRTDEYGGSFEGRARFPLETVRAVRAVMPEAMPLLVRISATDWAEGGWDVEQSIEFSKLIKAEGVDLVDCSSGGAVMEAEFGPLAKAGEVEPGYQVPLARKVRAGAEVPTAAVGLIREANHAAEIIAAGEADVVLLGRELLRSPYWPIEALSELKHAAPWPRQYERAVK